MGILEKLKPGSHIHLMGICGTAMGSLAGLLRDLNYKVTGSDQNVYPPMSTQLESLGIKIMQGYKKENLNPRPDFVIVGNVITKKHEEAIALLESDIPYTSLPKAIGELLIADRESYVICGTHGKTTTTALMSWICESSGLNPGFLIGGIPKNFPNSFRVPKSNTFVIEGDEYDTAFFDKVPKFNHYRPKNVILTSVEFDHVDIYPNMTEIRKSFTGLLERIPKNGVLVAHAEDPEIELLIGNDWDFKILTYGFEKGDYQARNISWDSEGVSFEVFKAGKSIDRVKANLFGDYNIKNALAVYVLALETGMSKDSIKKGMLTFQGVKRRQDVISEKNGITIIDDFAHHPTAVRLTVEAVQRRYQGRRVFSVFEPRSATSRRKVFEKEYTEAFKTCQHLVLPEVFNKDAIQSDDRLPIEAIVSSLNKSGHDVKIIPTVDQIVAHLKTTTKSGDVILIMSNGGFGGIYEKLVL